LAASAGLVPHRAPTPSRRAGDRRQAPAVPGRAVARAGPDRARV